MDYEKYNSLQKKYKRDLFELLDWQEKYALEYLCRAIYKYKDPENPDEYYNDWICFHTNEHWLGEGINREYLMRVCVDCGIFIYDYTDTFSRKFYEVSHDWREFLIDEFKLNEKK